jgi:hypothetical protein
MTKRTAGGAMKLGMPAWLRGFFLTAMLLALAAPACAQWTSADTQRAWADYNRAFLITRADGTEGFAMQQQNAATTGFWEDIEQIEMADDAYDWHVRSFPDGDHSAYAREVDALCEGFTRNNKFANLPSNDWSRNRFNDDLNWAVMAFAHAYVITKNPEWLAIAQTCFRIVWGRARNSNGGLNQTQPTTNGDAWHANEDSPVNYNFVIAGYLLFKITGDSSYRKDADLIYKWALTDGHLYDAGTGKVRDSVTGPRDFSYNYGIAIGAALVEGDTAAVRKILQWLMKSSNNPDLPYAALWKKFNILPDYHQGGKNNAGYNGIALRWIGMAARSGALTPAEVAWAQANVSLAFNLRNASGLMWNKWNTPTPPDGLYSWDCSSAMVGMLDIPAP